MFNIFGSKPMPTLLTDSEWARDRAGFRSRLSTLIDSHYCAKQKILFSLVGAMLGVAVGELAQHVKQSADEEGGTLDSEAIADKIIDLVEKSFRFDEFGYATDRERAVAEYGILKIMLKLRLECALNIVEKLSLGIESIVEYRERIKAKKESLVKVDKWGDVDETEWNEYLFEFGNEKVAIDSWDHLSKFSKNESVINHIANLEFVNGSVILTFLLLNDDELYADVIGCL